MNAVCTSCCITFGDFYDGRAAGRIEAMNRGDPSLAIGAGLELLARDGKPVLPICAAASAPDERLEVEALVRRPPPSSQLVIPAIAGDCLIWRRVVRHEA